MTARESLLDDAVPLVALTPPDEWPRLGPQLAHLALAAGVMLAGPDAGASSGLAGVLRVRSDGGVAPAPEPEGVSSLEVIVAAPAGHEPGHVRFGDSPRVPAVFRGRSLPVEDVPSTSLPPAAGEVLATIDGRPIWASRSETGVRRDTVAEADPWLGGEPRVFEHAKGRRLMRVLPVIE
jgi:hypothetical protein